MAFTDFGMAKGLAVVPDYQAMINQEDKRFSMENEAIQQKKADVEKQASEMKLGTVYDQYNQGRYNTFIKDVYKELTDFDIQNKGYEYDPEKLAKRKAIMAKIQDNDIIRESSQTKAEQDKLYDFIHKTPGAENMPAIKEQLAELSNVLTKGSADKLGFRFKQPVTKSIMDEITTLSGLIGDEKIQHKDGMFYTENVINDSKLESTISQYLLDPLNAELAKQAFANQSVLMQEMDQSPKAMMLRLTKASFNPKKSEPKQWNYTTANGTQRAPGRDNSFATFDYYGADVKNGTYTKGNYQLKALADGEFDPTTGNYNVAHKSSLGYPTIAYRRADGSYGSLRVHTPVTIVSGNDLVEIDAVDQAGKPIKTQMVSGVVQWSEKYTNATEIEGMRQKYQSQGAIISSNIADATQGGTITFQMPALMTPHNNPARYNQNVATMFNGAIPQGVIAKNGGVPSKIKNSSLKPGSNDTNSQSEEVELTSGPKPADAQDIGNGVFFSPSTGLYY